MPDDSITVRRARVSDAAVLARIVADPLVFAGLMQLPLPSEAVWRTRLEAFAAPDSNDLLMVAERAGNVVGSAGLHPATQLRRRHAAMLGISVAVEAQRQGVGRALMQALCDYADNWAQLLRLELNVFVDNVGAIRLYESCGFRHEGTLRAYAMRHGRYADVHTMARLHPHPPSIGWSDAGGGAGR